MHGKNKIKKKMRCDDLPATLTHVPVAAVLVLNNPDDGRLRPKHVEWLCRNKTCTVLHQVGVSFDLYYDARKNKIKKNKEMWWLTCNDNTCSSGRRTSFKYSWWWALAPETCRVTLQKQNLHSVASSWCFIWLILWCTEKNKIKKKWDVMTYLQR